MKIPILTLMMTLLIMTVTGQKKVELKFIYLPLTRYDQTSTTTSQNTITYDCTEEMKQALKEQGIENPMYKSDTTVNRLIMSTGEARPDGYFPIEINFESTSNKSLKELFPNGLMIYGEVPPNEFPQLDSLAAEGADESIKQIFMQTVQNMLSQFNFPAKKLKTGQSFKHKMPISIPILTASMEMEIISTYTLISIIDGSANFDIVQEFVVTSTINDQDISATGQGQGKVVYDIADCYFTDYDIFTEMKMNLKQELLTINLVQQSHVKQVTKISH